MLRILVLYGTTDGHTGKVAGALGDAFAARGVSVDVVLASPAAPRPEGYDGFVVGASVHAGGYQATVREWVAAHAAELKTRPSAFISVCLGVLQKEPQVQAEVAATMDRFLTATHWQPTFVKAVAGALLYRRYNWFTRQMMKQIAAKAGGDIDTSRDYEYTDWDDLCAFAEMFAGVVADASAPAVRTPAQVA